MRVSIDKCMKRRGALSRGYAFAAAALFVLYLSACVPSKTGSAETLPAETTSEAPLEISEFQQALLGDGVTPEEYQIAVDAWANCYKSQGLLLTYLPTPENPLSVYNVAPDPEGPLMSLDNDLRESQRASSWIRYRCGRDYFDEVQFQYVSSKTLTGDAHDVGMKALVDCLERRVEVTGLSVNDSYRALQTRIEAQIPKEKLIESSACFQQHPYLFPPQIRWNTVPPQSEEWFPPQK